MMGFLCVYIYTKLRDQITIVVTITYVKLCFLKASMKKESLTYELWRWFRFVHNLGKKISRNSEANNGGFTERNRLHNLRKQKLFMNRKNNVKNVWEFLQWCSNHVEESEVGLICFYIPCENVCQRGENPRGVITSRRHVIYMNACI